MFTRGGPRSENWLVSLLWRYWTRKFFQGQTSGTSTNQRLFEVIETLGKIYLISEWIQGGELYSRIADIGPLEESHASILFYQLLMAVKHLHSLGYVHRDIKAENVLMLSEERIKLADFGFSTQLINGPLQHLDTFCGSPPYAAPELFSDDHYIGGPVDIWALGILLYFMLQAKMPFRASTVPLLRTAVLRGDFEISTTLSLPCSRLIQRILVHAPTRRPTIEQLLKCQWFEYAQTVKPETHKKPAHHASPNTSSQHSEVPITQRKRFRFFPTRGQRRQYSPNQSSSFKNINAANQTNAEDTTIIRTIKCCTKRANSVLEEDFLNPIETARPSIGIDVVNNNSNSNFREHVENALSKGRKFSFSRLVKKRIGPLELSSSQQSTDGNSNYNGSDYRERLQKLVEDEHGIFVMFPTASENNNMHSHEKETRRLMANLGIDSDMIEKSIQNGPRSDIVGIYRIVVHRMQKEHSIVNLTGNAFSSEIKSNINQSKCDEKSYSDKNTSTSFAKNITCVIL
ncbi:uncharacterized protein LOC129748526 isoform X2 [Uranotaenia lowii]|uniref:uncharacterized protein LOC129748526 isoform X2 n=1 Tax=Uranotaenia lowii TaxID=190385 RepID=UPI00247856CD|nr:uncharacterized protein LOC129748526 isoform X2 [Uranotaenia lowii]XP_055599154.1 uncharacterized protein LOC129748526 isoform X2 [Uranotaenia lowii]XP_055599155.1 uncharacterized protein LOC129748526 isoform X2 [Uranotaenia lowii]